MTLPGGARLARAWVLTLPIVGCVAAPTAGRDAGGDSLVLDGRLDPAHDASPASGDGADEVTVDASSDARADEPVRDGPSDPFDPCLRHTADEAACKDCCDCLTVTACAQLATCRDTCVRTDFHGNTDTVPVHPPMVLGMRGDYSRCASLATQQACKACCECSGTFVCGDFRWCRDSCAHLPDENGRDR